MKINILILILVAFLLNACNVGVKKDLLSGLKTSNNGLSLDEAYLMMDNAKLNSNEFPLDKEIVLYVGGIKGFTAKGEKVFLGASMIITDDKGTQLMNETDLFANTNESGFTLEESEAITLTLIVGKPLEPGKKYSWKSKIWDKNGKGTIDTELEFTVK